MKRIRQWAGAAGVVLVALTGCSKPEPPAMASPAEPAPAARSGSEPSPPSGTSRVISSARDSLHQGNVDEAAARLAQLQVQRAAFNAEQAKDYRQLFSEAYDRAIEAVQRGDPRGEAALQLLRAAAPR